MIAYPLEEGIVVAAKKEKVIEIMDERLTEDVLEDPVQPFCEKVEKARGGGEAKGEECIDVILVVPFKYEEPIVVGADRYGTKGVLQIALVHLSPFAEGEESCDCVVDRLIFEGTEMLGDAVVH